MFRKKKISELKEILFDQSSSTSTREDAILTLMNMEEKKHIELVPLLKEYLNYEEPKPIHPIINYKGEMISGIKTLIINKLVHASDETLSNFFLELLKKYYPYKEMRKSLIEALSNSKFNMKLHGIRILFSQIWQEQVPISLVKEISSEYLDVLPDNEQITNLYWILLTPEDSASSDFPKYFDKQVYDKLVGLKGNLEVFKMLIQTMADKITKPGPNYYQKDYLKSFHDIFDILIENEETVMEIDDKQNIILFLRTILRNVSQSEAAKYLVEYNDRNTNLNQFLFFWKQQIISRLKLRKNTLNLLVAFGDVQASHEIFILESADKFTLENLKELYKELNSVHKFASSENLNEILMKLELILEILEWSFIELLDNPDKNSKFEIIKAILTKFEILTKAIPENESSAKFIELLRFTAEEAINQYLFRQSILQKIFKSEEFLLKLQQREIKYIKMETDKHHQLAMKFNNLKIMSDKQKKRFLHLLSNINPFLAVDFITNLNDVVTRIMNRNNYYVLFRPSLKMYNPKLEKKETKFDLEDLEGFVKKFYINFERLIASSDTPHNILSFRRIDAVNDLINDFLSYNGLIDFETEYFTV